MGRLTRAQIVSEGLLLGGNTQLTPRANVWLNDWLFSQYAGWPWPFLIRRSPAISLPAGTQTITVGGGNSGITDTIQQVVDPLYIYSADKRTRYQCRIRASTGAPVGLDQDTLDPSSMSVPTLVRIVRPNDTTTQWGTWMFYFSPISGPVSYLVSFDYYFIPANLPTDSTGDALIPLYPNDRTMIQMINAECAKYQDRTDKYSQEADLTRSMVIDDRMKFGEIVGTNDSIGLDPSVYGGPNFSGAF